MMNRSRRDPQQTGRAGGLERASRLAPETRSQIARYAAQKRWGSTVLPAGYTGDLTLGDTMLACAVLIDDNGNPTRVISQSTMLAALGRSRRRRASTLAQSCSPPTFSLSSRMSWPRCS